MQNIKESKIENDVCNYAKLNKCLVFKFKSPSQRGVPDRIFLKNNQILFIEFKKPGGKLTKLQKLIINKLKIENFLIFVIDNVEQGKLLIDKFILGKLK